MFKDWPFIKKLIWLYRTVINAVPAALKTVTGSIIHVLDALAKPAEALSVSFAPVQSGSGDPSPDNVRPISGWTGLTVWRTGANIFDGEVESGYYYTSSGLPASSNAAYRTKNPIPVLPETTYYILNSPHAVANGKSIVIFCYKEDGTFIKKDSSSSKSRPFTTPVDCRKVKFYVDEAIENFDGIMVSFGSTAPSAWSAYSGNSYTISWQTKAGTVYGGTFDVTSGVLTVTMASVDLGTLTYTYMSLSGGRNAFISHIDGIVPHASNDVPINAISSAYKAVSYNSPWTNGDMSYTRDAGGTADKQQVTFVNNDYTDAAAFKTAMAGQTLCYELATPQTIQLTPTELTLLLGENNLWSDSNGDLSLTYYADGRADDVEALNLLLGGRYVNNHGEDEPTDREALDIILGR